MTTGSNSNDPADDPRPDYVTSRLRYFGGEFLSTQAFVDEQNYHVDRQTRHEACLHAPGILEGLDVTQTPASSTSVFVSFGSALDADGNQILLSDAHGNSTGDPIELNMPSGDGDYIVDIMFVETKSAPQSGSEGDTRFTQDPDKADDNGNTMLAIGTLPRSGAVPLARVRVTDGQISGIDTQKYAGVKLPGPSGNGATLRVENVSDDPNNDPDYKVLLSGSGGLDVDGPITVSDTLTAQSGLNVTGLLTANGGIGVSSTHIYEDGTMSIGHAQTDNDPVYPLEVWDSSSNSSLLAATPYGVYSRVYLYAQAGLVVTGTADGSELLKVSTSDGMRVTGEARVSSLLTASGGLMISGTQIDNSGQVAIGKSAAPSNPLEVYDGRNELLSVSASSGLTVTGTATVSDTLTAEKSLVVTGLLTANGGFGVSSTQIYENGTMSIGNDRSNSSHPLEVWVNSAIDGDIGDPIKLLAINSNAVNALVKLNAQAGLAVTGTATVSSKVSIGTTSAPTSPLEVYQGENQLLSVSASDGMTVTGTATVSDTLTAQSRLNVTGLLTANGGFGVSSTQIYENGTMSIGNDRSNSSHPLEVWVNSAIDSDIGDPTKLLSINSSAVNALVKLDAQAGLAVTGTATVSSKVSIGTTSAPTSPLEVYQGENQLLSVSATDGMTVTGTATVSDTLTAQSSLNVSGLLTANDGLEVTGTVQMLGSWVEVNDSPYTISEGNDPTNCNTTAAESDGFAVVRLSMTGTSDDARGWAELWTSPQGSGADIRLGRCSNHQNDDKVLVQDNSVTAPIRKGDGWYVKGACTQYKVVVSVYWIPFGNN